MGKLGIIAELFDFLRARRNLWLWPIVVFLLGVGVLVVFLESSAVAPFIYAIF